MVRRAHRDEGCCLWQWAHESGAAVGQLLSSPVLVAAMGVWGEGGDQSERVGGGETTQGSRMIGFDHALALGASSHLARGGPCLSARLPVTIAKEPIPAFKITTVNKFTGPWIASGLLRPIGSQS